MHFFSLSLVLALVVLLFFRLSRYSFPPFLFLFLLSSWQIMRGDEKFLWEKKKRVASLFCSLLSSLFFPLVTLSSWFSFYFSSFSVIPLFPKQNESRWGERNSEEEKAAASFHSLLSPHSFFHYPPPLEQNETWCGERNFENEKPVGYIFFPSPRRLRSCSYPFPSDRQREKWEIGVFVCLLVLGAVLLFFLCLHGKGET